MRLRTLLLACALLPLSTKAAAPLLSQAAFCITRTETGCGEVALPDTFVDYNRMQKRADGTRIISYFSIQDAMPANTVFVHVLEAEDAEPQVESVVSDANGAKLGDVKKQLTALEAKFKDRGHVVLTPFRKGSQGGRVFSELPVRGPGLYNGTVVDLSGNVVAGGETSSFSVSRER